MHMILEFPYREPRAVWIFCRRIPAILVLTCLVVLALSCGATASQSETIVVYSGRSENLIGPLIQQFRDITGVEVKVKYGKTSEMVATLQEEGESSPADVFLGQEPAGLIVVQNLLSKLPDRVLDAVPTWARSPEGRWVGISGRARTVVYNTDQYAEEQLPDDLYAFTDPKWRGLIGWAPTNASFQTMVTSMRVIWGEEKTRRWLVAMYENQPQNYPNNSLQVAGVASGEIAIGLVNHYYLHRLLAAEGENYPVRNYHPRSGGPGAMISVAAAGILSSSKNNENAHDFLQFLLSTDAQTYFTGQVFEFPLVDEVSVVDNVLNLSEIKHPGVSFTDLADVAGTQHLLRETGVLP